jgi:hypothetical protein
MYRHVHTHARAQTFIHTRARVYTITHTRTRVQDAVLLDPYAQAVLSRRHWGKLAPDHDWEAPGMLGFAATWPQAAGALPSQDVFDWEGEVVP